MPLIPLGGGGQFQGIRVDATTGGVVVRHNGPTACCCPCCDPTKFASSYALAWTGSFAYPGIDTGQSCGGITYASKSWDGTIPQTTGDCTTYGYDGIPPAGTQFTLILPDGTHAQHIYLIGPQAAYPVDHPICRWSIYVTFFFCYEVSPGSFVWYSVQFVYAKDGGDTPAGTYLFWYCANNRTLDNTCAGATYPASITVT